MRPSSCGRRAVLVVLLAGPLVPFYGSLSQESDWATGVVFAQENSQSETMPVSAGRGPEEIEKAINALSGSVTTRGLEKAEKVPLLLERSVQFQTAEGEPAILEEGNYLVEVNPTPPLKVISEIGNQTWILSAISGSHDEKVTEVASLSVSGEKEDSHHLVLLLPTGKTVDASGSYSGIGTRSTSPLQSSLLKLPAVQTPKIVVPVSQLKLRPVLPKPGKETYYKGLFRDRVIVKFREGAPVRLSQPPTKSPKPSFNLATSLMDNLSNSKLQQSNLTNAKVLADLATVNALVKRPTVKGTLPLFSRSDTFLKNERLEAEQKTGEEHADLSNYYTIMLEPGQEGEKVVDELNALPSVERAYLAPIPEDADIPPPPPVFRIIKGTSTLHREGSMHSLPGLSRTAGEMASASSILKVIGTFSTKTSALRFSRMDF